MRWTGILVAVWLLGVSLPAQLTVPALFSDHMVLQADSDVVLTGTDKPNECVSVIAGWGAEARGMADSAGCWKLTLRTSTKPGPFEVRIKGSSEKVLHDVLCGEVWLCGGQSNMEWTLGPGVGKGTSNHEAVVAAARSPNIRLFDVPNVPAVTPQTQCGGQWECGDGPQVGKWSAVAWYFARALQGVTGKPIGLIVSAWGGTPAESWMSRAALDKHGGFEDPLKLQSEPGFKPGPNQPGALWNGMMAPLLPYRIRGAIFYQGESNRTRWKQYRTLFPALIADWRAHFDSGEFPFLFTQIAPFRYDKDVGEAALLREAQLFTAQTVTGAAMAVTMDIGNPADIHPLNKQDVGSRLAAAALAMVHGRKLVFEGPCLVRSEVEGATMVLHMNDGGATMEAREGLPLTCFTIAGEDRVFHPATARIKGSTIIVNADAVSAPRAVRFAWGCADQPNLRNVKGFPASSFRTDDWPLH